MTSLNLDPSSLRRDGKTAAIIFVVLLGFLHMWVDARGTTRSFVVILLATTLPPAIFLSIATAIDPRLFICLAKKDYRASPSLRLIAISICLVGIALGLLLASHYVGDPLLGLF